MKKLIVIACLGYAFVVSAPAFAGEQQNKMKGCNAEAKANGLKGDERKAFMKKCLKKDYELKSAEKDGGKSADAASGKNRQQEKMKSCNAEAKTRALAGAERKSFMSACLKN